MFSVVNILTLLLALTASLLNAAAEELLSVNLSIDGREYGIKFPSTLSAATVAQQFCAEQGAELGVTEASLQNCLVPVEKFLFSAVSDDVRRRTVASLNQESILIKVTVNEAEYDISFSPSSVSIEAVATTFCTDKASELGITPDLFPSCYDQMSAYLLDQMRTYINTPKIEEAISTTTGTTIAGGETMTLPMRVGDKEYTLQFIPQQTSPEQIATQFCVEQGASLGFTNESIGSCITPITNYLFGAIKTKTNPSPPPKLLDVSLTVGDSEFTLSFDPFTVSSTAAAQEFCSSRGDSFGVTEETFSASCLQPVAKLIQEAVDRNIRA